MTRNAIAAIALLLAATAQTYAQNAEPDQKLALARELADITFSEDAFNTVLEQVIAAVMATMRPQLTAVVKHPPTVADVEKLTVVIRSTIATLAPKSAWVEALAPVYAKYLTLEDLSALIAFHKTPLGQRMLQVQGRVIAEGAAVGQRMFEGREAEFLEVLIKELRKVFPQ